MRLRRLALLALAAATLALALPAAAPAAEPEPVALEVEASTGTGFGEVQCKVGSGVAEECEFEYDFGTKLTLVPVPEIGSEFAGFQNGTGSASACAGTKPCTFTIKADSYVEAPFDLAYRTLTVGFMGSGEGEIACGVEGGFPEGCEDEYLLGTELTLVPEAEAGSEFAGFLNGKGSASGCVGTSPCIFVLEANSSVDARFEPIRHVLSIVKDGSGSGTVACNGGPCAPSYPEGTEITLTATPSPGSAFAGFSGEGCSGAVPCTVWIEAPAEVLATFEDLASAEVEDEAAVEAPGSRGVAHVVGAATVKGGKALLKLRCSGGPCRGSLKLTMRVRQGRGFKKLVVAKGPIGLDAGAVGSLKVKLAGVAIRELNGSAVPRATASGTGVARTAIRLVAAA